MSIYPLVIQSDRNNFTISLLTSHAFLFLHAQPQPQFTLIWWFHYTSHLCPPLFLFVSLFLSPLVTSLLSSSPFPAYSPRLLPISTREFTPLLCQGLTKDFLPWRYHFMIRTTANARHFQTISNKHLSALETITTHWLQLPGLCTVSNSGSRLLDRAQGTVFPSSLHSTVLLYYVQYYVFINCLMSR